MTLRKIFISLLLLGSMRCQAIQPVWDEILPGQGIFSSIGLSPEASHMVFGEQTNALLKNVWVITVRSARIAFYSRFLEQIQWLEKNYILSSDYGDQLIKKITDTFVNDGSLDKLTINMSKVLSEQGLPSDTIEASRERFKESFTKMLIQRIKEDAFVRSTVAVAALKAKTTAYN